MRRSYTLIFLLILIFGVLTYLNLTRPEVVQNLLIKIDVFGITELSRNEQERESKINNLPITWEEKQVLLNKTVFMDASPEMVKLALGDPKKTLQKTMNDNRVELSLIYYLPNDKRPTILVFVGDKLTQAYKGSALDF